MQISGSHTLSSLRQPGSMMGGQQGQRLVFLYPMIFDGSLTALMNDIRDFVSVDFMTEIKISNVLNITSKATQIGTVRSGNNSLNPAQEVRKSLHYSFDLPGSDNNQYSDQIAASAYQEKINSFLNFIRNQLKYDPRYLKLRPMISNITLQENLINIPLILGTKAYTSQSSALYWILVISMAYGISLDSESNLNLIERYLDSMPDNKYVDLLFSTSGRQMLMNAVNLPANRFNNLLKHDKRILHTISSKIQSETSKSLRDLRACINIAQWEVETNHMAIDTNRISQTMVPTIPTSTQRIHFEKSMASFNSYISNTIIPILHNMEYLLGPTPTHLNFQLKVNEFEYNGVESLTQNFIELSNHVTGQIRQLIKIQNGEVSQVSNADTIRQASEYMKNIMSICQANVDNIAEIKKILINELDPIVHLPIRFTGDDVARFAKGLYVAGSKLNRHSQIIEDWIRNILVDPTPFNTHINTIKQRFQDSIRMFLYGPNPDNALYDERIENNNNNSYFLERYQNFVHVICNNPTGSSSQITCRERLTQLITQLETSIHNIMCFFYLWNFISYLCGYMKDVDIDIQIQRRDVLEFPNYCLVLPLDIIKLLYSLNTISNFKNLVSSNAGNYDEVIQQLNSSEDDIIVNTDNINKMIQIVNRRLKVPNLIVINKQRNELYYQFMYMNRPNKLSIPNMQAYVKHQIDILPGF